MIQRSPDADAFGQVQPTYTSYFETALLPLLGK